MAGSGGLITAQQDQLPDQDLPALGNYALRHRWVDAYIGDRIERPAVEDKEPGVFTVTEAKQLLKNAAKFGLLPYTAIGFFAGLRAAELLRLEC